MDCRIVSSLEGVNIYSKKRIGDQRGMVMHMLRSDSPEFINFGEIYFSLVNPGITKGWKRHKIMDQNIVVPVGSIKFTLFDEREGSTTHNCMMSLILGEQNYQLLHIPKMIWYKFENLYTSSSLIANCSTIPHDPMEVELLPLDSKFFEGHPVTGN